MSSRKHLENGTIRFNKNSLIEADPELVGRAAARDRRTRCVRLSIAPDKRKGTDKDEYPIDKDNHGCDMTRYLCDGG